MGASFNKRAEKERHLATIGYHGLSLHSFYVPPTEGGGHIVFGADPICVGVHVASFRRDMSPPTEGGGHIVFMVRSAHLSPGLPMGFTRVNPGWALSLILKKWVLSGSSLFLMFTFVYFTVI